LAGDALRAELANAKLAMHRIPLHLKISHPCTIFESPVVIFIPPTSLKIRSSSVLKAGRELNPPDGRMLMVKDSKNGSLLPEA
jgi:hypothetical protein